MAYFATYSEVIAARLLQFVCDLFRNSHGPLVQNLRRSDRRDLTFSQAIGIFRSGAFDTTGSRGSVYTGASGSDKAAVCRSGEPRSLGFGDSDDRSTKSMPSTDLQNASAGVPCFPTFDPTKNLPAHSDLNGAASLDGPFTPNPTIQSIMGEMQFNGRLDKFEQGRSNPVRSQATRLPSKRANTRPFSQPVKFVTDPTMFTAPASNLLSANNDTHSNPPSVSDLAQENRQLRARLANTHADLDTASAELKDARSRLGGVNRELASIRAICPLTALPPCSVCQQPGRPASTVIFKHAHEKVRVASVVTSYASTSATPTSIASGTTRSPAGHCKALSSAATIFYRSASAAAPTTSKHRASS